MKKILVILFATFVSVISFAQVTPPTPGENPSSNANAKRDMGMNRASGPVGTATALLLSLGAGTAAYKLRKNKKENNNA
ncbi:MAG: hypothetical protein II878_02080 [Bacteroidales bacterium]|nr:hypothetical protein [Bacteroidales bacterium]